MISKRIALPHQYLSSVAIDDCQASQMLKQVGLPLPWQILKECCLGKLLCAALVHTNYYALFVKDVCFCSNTIIMQIKRKLQLSARNSILRIYGRI